MYPHQRMHSNAENNKENNQQYGRPMPQGSPLKYDRFGNPVPQANQSGYNHPSMNTSAANDTLNSSMRSNNSQTRRPGSASKLQNSFDQSRNRFFSPQNKSRASKSRERSQDRSADHRQQQFMPHPTPNQLLNPGQQPQNNMQNRGFQDKSNMSDENFSDENHSPVRPMSNVNPIQSGALKQQHVGLRQRFGTSITGSVTNFSSSAANTAKNQYPPQKQLYGQHSNYQPPAKPSGISSNSYSNSGPHHRQKQRQGQGNYLSPRPGGGW